MTQSIAKLIDGKSYAAQIRSTVAEKAESLKANHNITPGLAVVIVGHDPASQIYVRNKIKQTAAAGMNSFHHELPDNTSEKSLLDLVESLNNENSVHGILVQLPLPKHIDSSKVIAAIAPEKDVDGFHVTNAGLLATGGNAMVPCTPLGCLIMLQDQLGDLSGKDAIVVGRSNIVGKPMAQLLLQANATVTMAHSRTANLEEKVKQADIVVAAVGVAELIKGHWIKDGATVIDVGMNRIDLPDGKTKLLGDVDFAGASAHAAAITPVPGGVGPMTIACLLKNTITACCRQNNLAEQQL